MKKILALITFVYFIVEIAISQSYTLSPNPLFNAICPGVTTEFTIGGIPTNCSDYSVSLVSGSAVFTNVSSTVFSINAANTPQEIKVKFDPKSSVTCGNAQTFTIPVLSVSSLTPSIVGCRPLARGKSHTITLTATQLYQFKGLSDPSEVVAYTWAVSGGNGWTFTTSNGTNSDGTVVFGKNLRLTTDLCSGASVSVFATDHCGGTSLVATCSIDRFTEAPTVSGAPSYVVCCNTQPIALNANQATGGLAGYTYNWDFGSWTGNANGAGASVTPTGSSAGNITVAAVACGVSSGNAVAKIPLEIVEPATQLTGDANACTGQPSAHWVSPAPQSCANVVWNVSPSAAVLVSSGTGTKANLSASPAYNGYATITFTIETPCGNKSYNRSFFVGTPILYDIELPDCFNRYTTIPISVKADGAYRYTWGLPGCDVPINPNNEPGWYDPQCWYNLSGSPTQSNQVVIYVGNNSGYISVWAENQCGSVSRAEEVRWCNPQVYGEGPHYPKIGGLNNRSTAAESGTAPFKLYPNPSSDYMTLEFNPAHFKTSETKTVQIINEMGQVISLEKTEGPTYRKDIQSIPNGHYFVNIKCLDKVYNAKLLKN